jgi:hypothetical protein
LKRFGLWGRGSEVFREREERNIYLLLFFFSDKGKMNNNERKLVLD